MSGHSKWATIKRQKGANDAKRGVLFTKLSNAISVAVRQGGGVGDPNQNFKLRLAVDAARAANMPKENIERAIARASGKEGKAFEEVMYEGFGPGGISVIVEAATDNKNRTTPEVKSAFEKNGGTLGQMGSVAYQFQLIGRITLPKGAKTLEEIFMEAAEVGAQDIEEGEDEVYIYAEPGVLGKIRDMFLQNGYTITATELIRKPITTIDIEDEEILTKIAAFLDRIEEMDDVQKVYANIAGYH
ncbi:MAG TPA: YebC/PmpR family DNA-binding transcriptional regulator [Candidatus Saccharimonadales bacterium]|nr:YebC/PmpR family DNA-binding transcriptional regulator [Candidatus Saccharimonadales bacterium]